MAKSKVIVIAAALVALGLGGGGAIVWKVAHESAAGERARPGVAGEPAGTAVAEPAAGGRVEVVAAARAPHAESLAGGATVAGTAPPRLLVAKDEHAAVADAGPAAPPRLGTLPKNDIRAAVQTAIPEIKKCFVKLLEEEPKAGGRLIVRFVLEERDGAGQITEATVVPQDRDGGTREFVAPLAEQCILNALVATPFPAPVGGKVTVNYPFLLSAD